MKVTALAGGVGGAKLADGLYRSPKIDELSIIVNIGDDFEHFGLSISPDIDTICYTLAGIANPETGWGRSEETYATLNALKLLGAPLWFKLGDKDIATHMERTRLLRSGISLSTVTARLCDQWRITCQIFPASDDSVPTIIQTEDDGPLTFQEYFVHHQCKPRVKEFIYQDAANAKPAPGVLDAIAKSNLVVFCPSNPWVSLDPILAIPGIRDALIRKRVIAISPIIGGKTVKGPAAKMFSELAIEPSPLAIAEHYQDILSGIMIDIVDEQLAKKINSLGMKTCVTETIMKDAADRIRLSESLMEFSFQLDGTGW